MADRRRIQRLANVVNRTRTLKILGRIVMSIFSKFIFGTDKIEKSSLSIKHGLWGLGVAAIIAVSIYRGCS